MKLLRLRDAPARPVGPVFRNQSWRALAAVVVFFVGLTGYILIPKGEPTPIEIVMVPCFATFVFFLLLALRLRHCMRGENWLLKVGSEGIYVHLRSYLNHHLPEDSPTVLFLTDQEVRSVSLTREDRYLPGRHGGSKSHDRFSYVDIEVLPAGGEGELNALEAALFQERRLPGRREDDYPVRLVSRGEAAIVRLVWDQIRPGEARAAAVLGERYHRLPDRNFETPRWDSLDEAAKQDFIAALWEMGHTEDAEHLVQAQLSVSRYRARAYLKEHFEEAGK